MQENVTQSEFPFHSKISLRPLLKSWSIEEPCLPLFQHIAQEVTALQSSHEILFEPHEDTAFVAQNEDLVKLILAPVLSCSESRRNLMAVARPYVYDFVYATPAFNELLLDSEQRLVAQPKMDQETASWGRQLAVYAEIARQIYDLDFGFDPSPVYTVSDPATGLNRYYQFNFDNQYLEIVPLKSPKKLSAKQIAKLQSNLMDLTLWAQYIPPLDFELHGVVVVQAMDITRQEVISELQQAMTAGTKLISGQGLQLLNRSVRDLLAIADVKIRLISSLGDKVFMVNAGCDGYAGCLISNSRHFDKADFKSSIYEQAALSGQMVSVTDTQTLTKDNPIHQVLLADGVQNLVLFPLMDDNKIIGALQLEFPEAGSEHAEIALKICDITTIATLGVKQSRQMLEQGVRATIQKKCSVVHPAVEWRFREAAFNMITGANPGDMEEIVFREVYPLFAETDIKNSSAFRNRAIQADLMAQLQLASTILTEAGKQRPMPILDEMQFRIDRFLSNLEQGLRSGDELSMDQFFRFEFAPMLKQLGYLGANVEQAIEGYRKRLDPRFSAVYEKRREYEDSVLRINNKIAQFLEFEEQQAQKMFPHYFEITCTDGVEMMMYLGASMVEDGRFDPFYLRNLRLWQLRVTCEIARLCKAIQPELKLPLETTHLILAQDAPLSIRFSETEKDFIVDGAYNIRYEIMKKRIDKALTRDGSERLTQPGKIAIVYSHNREAHEYQRYIDYLQHQGYLEPDVEELQLEALQGLEGLRALRVSVCLDKPDQKHLPEQSPATIVSALQDAASLDKIAEMS